MLNYLGVQKFYKKNMKILGNNENKIKVMQLENKIINYNIK